MSRPEEPLRALEVIDVGEEVSTSGLARVTGEFSVEAPDDDPAEAPLVDQVTLIWRRDDGCSVVWELSAREAIRLAGALESTGLEAKPRD